MKERGREGGREIDTERCVCERDRVNPDTM